jgi:hypothetical protein
MTIATDRTAEERAAAWDYVMSSIEGESVAITKPWCWLRGQVTAREGATRVAGDKALTVASETVVQFRGVQVHDRDFGYLPGDDARS